MNKLTNSDRELAMKCICATAIVLTVLVVAKIVGLSDDLVLTAIGMVISRLF